MSYIEDFSSRLKHERERLRLPQARFAEACGVGNTTQYNYEKGDREPSVSYLLAVEKLGVDLQYLLHGDVKREDVGDAAKSHEGERLLLSNIEMLLGLEEVTSDEIIEKALGVASIAQRTDGAYNEWQISVLKWLATCSKPDRCVDAKLLARLLDLIDVDAKRKELHLTSEKRVMAALMLYYDAKPATHKRHSFLSRPGIIDQHAIDKAVNLASS